MASDPKTWNMLENLDTLESFTRVNYSITVVFWITVSNMCLQWTCQFFNNLYVYSSVIDQRRLYTELSRKIFNISFQIFKNSHCHRGIDLSSGSDAQLSLSMISVRISVWKLLAEWQFYLPIDIVLVMYDEFWNRKIVKIVIVNFQDNQRCSSHTC